jgi:hypothetical protein
MARTLLSPLTDDQFAQWWAAYPRRIAKGAARVAFDKALGRIRGPDPFETLLSATRLFAESAISWDIKFLPYPATYLNQGRWEDDIEDVRRSYAKPATRADERLAERGASLQRMLAGAMAAADGEGIDSGGRPEDRR